MDHLHGTSALAARTFLSTAVTEGGVPRPMPAGTRVMLRFTGDGRLLASAGCNTAAAELARRVRATLSGDVGYQIEADQLTLTGTGADGLGAGLQLTADPQLSPP